MTYTDYVTRSSMFHYSLIIKEVSLQSIIQVQSTKGNIENKCKYEGLKNIDVFSQTLPMSQVFKLF